MSIGQWSTTAANNASGVTGINWAEGQPPSSVNDSARETMAQVATWLGQASGAIPEYLTAVSGTNTITATGPSQMASYVAGQRFTFIPANTITGATTINITPSGASALGAKNVFISGQACVGGELVANVPATVLYDGTQFNILSRSKRPTVQVYTATGANTWTKPTGLSHVVVEVVGGGGNGGATPNLGGSGNSSAGGGGGAAGYTRKVIGTAALGGTETATVGAAATASTFGAHCTGGAGTTGSAGGSGATGAGGAAGAGSSGDVNATGGAGESGAISNPIFGGSGGTTVFGGGGIGGIGAAANGGSAGGYGAGGGGAAGADPSTGQTGGAGAPGIIIVTEFYA